MHDDTATTADAGAPRHSRQKESSKKKRDHPTKTLCCAYRRSSCSCSALSAFSIRWLQEKGQPLSPRRQLPYEEAESVQRTLRPRYRPPTWRRHPRAGPDTSSACVEKATSHATVSFSFTDRRRCKERGGALILVPMQRHALDLDLSVSAEHVHQGNVDQDTCRESLCREGKT